MRYTQHQLQLMAQIIVDAETNSTHKYNMFMRIMQQRTRMDVPTILERIKGYL